MITNTVSPMALPRSRALTDLLTDSRGTPISERDLKPIRHRTEAILRGWAATIESGRKIRIDAYSLRPDRGRAQWDQAFEWSPESARRPVALDAVRTCLATGGTPADAVRSTIDRLVRSGSHPLAGRHTLCRWLAGLSLGARSLVEAEAVTMATQLITAVDWTRLVNPAVGDDRTISFASSPRLFLRGRIDLRTSIEVSTDRAGPVRRSALLTVVAGRPQPTARAVLGSRADLPIRIIGWWPQCGRALAVPVTAELLEETVDAVAIRLGSVAPGPTHPQRCDGQGHRPGLQVGEGRLAS